MDNEKVKNEAIVMTEEWRDQLEQMPFVSKQKGRMSHLLKMKSKVGVIHKERAKYEPLDFQKRFKDKSVQDKYDKMKQDAQSEADSTQGCLLYTSPSPRDS